jgi:hypothetical protein
MTGQLPPDDDGPEETTLEPTTTCAAAPPEAESLDEGTLREPIACMGEYPDIPAFLRATLEVHVDPAAAWILDYLDYEAVLAKFEGPTYRFFWEEGRVFRMGLDERTARAGAGAAAFRPAMRCVMDERWIRRTCVDDAMSVRLECNMHAFINTVSMRA